MMTICNIKRFTAIVCSIMAMAMLVSCDIKQVTGDTPLEVESESAQFNGSFKLLSWNIQDGMWCDQFNNYDDFVAYINEINPDVFCIQEAATHWDIDGKTLSHYSRYLPYPDQKNKEELWDNPSGWVALAKRWGHDYVVMGPYLDNYPVVITSKYPLELVKRLRGDGSVYISHGAVHAKVHFSDSYVVNLVNLHLKPSTAERPATESNLIRLNEVNYYMAQTINSEAHYQDQHWLMMGDFNDSSGDDVDQEVRKNSYYDLWAEMNNYTKSYIDFIFGTEAMRKTLKSIDFLYGFAHTEKVMESVNGVPINGTAGVWKYSDHYPVVAEFSIYK